jgi:phage repressor protein C with HTH and peptisase S24 domain
MSWADKAIEHLSRGKEIEVRPRGNSMTPKIRSGALCKLVPLGDCKIKRGDILLVKVRGNIYLHLVSAVDKDRVQISNNHGHVNGWTSKSNIFGRLESVDNSDTA